MFIIRWIASLLYALYKIFTRLRILYYMYYLRKIKERHVAKKLNIDLRRPITVESQMLACALLPLNIVLAYLRSFAVNLTTTFVADKHPNYLKMMLKSGTRENELFKLSMIYLSGTLFAIIFFYVQVYMLERFDDSTLWLSLTMLAFCAILPLFSKMMLLLFLLMIPTAAFTMLRATFYATLILELHLIAWSNIDNNIDNLAKTISCEKRLLHDMRRSLIDEVVGDPRKMNSPNRIPLAAEPKDGKDRNLLYTFRDLTAKLKSIYRKGVYSIYVSKRLWQIFTEWFYSLLDIDLNWDINFFGFTIRLPFGELMRALKDLAKMAFEPLARGFKGVVHNLSENFKQTFKDHFTIRFNSNMVFRVESNMNVSFARILITAKERFLEKHWYFSYAKQAVNSVATFYLMCSFISMIIFSFSYLVLFRNVASFNNCFLTGDFLRYDQTMQRVEGRESLLPLYVFELSQYVKLTSSRLSASELRRMALAMIAFWLTAAYVGVTFAIDYVAYKLCTNLRDWIAAISDDLSLIPDVRLESNGSIFNSMMSLFDQQQLRQMIRSCAPLESPPDWDLYHRCGAVLLLLLAIAIAEPYLRRTRVYACGRMYPERVRLRSKWLYTRIIFRRLVQRTIVNISMPMYQGLIFMKMGEGNVAEDSSSFFAATKWWTVWRDTWPLSLLAKALGFSKPKPECCKCAKKLQIDAPRTIKCPNWRCSYYYCIDCFDSLRKKCIKCNVEVRITDEQISEETDSSAEF